MRYSATHWVVVVSEINVYLPSPTDTHPSGTVLVVPTSIYYNLQKGLVLNTTTAHEKGSSNVLTGNIGGFTTHTDDQIKSVSKYRQPACGVGEMLLTQIVVTDTDRLSSAFWSITIEQPFYNLHTADCQFSVVDLVVWILINPSPDFLNMRTASWSSYLKSESAERLRVCSC